MPGTIKAVIWDMGGVLLQLVDDRPRQELAKKFSVTLGELDKLVFNSETARLATLGALVARGRSAGRDVRTAPGRTGRRRPDPDLRQAAPEPGLDSGGFPRMAAENRAGGRPARFPHPDADA